MRVRDGRVAVADGERRPDELREVLPGVDPERREHHRRQPVEEDEQHEDQHDAEPERRHREPGDREHPHRVVDPGVLLERRDHAERDREHGRHDRRHHGELEREREPQLDLLGDRRSGPHRDAEVEVRESPHPARELLPDGLVEAELRALDLQHLLRRELPLRDEADVDDVARDDAQQQEDQHRDPDQGRDHQQEALDDVLRQRHFSPRAGGGARRRRRTKPGASPRTPRARRCRADC